MTQTSPFDLSNFMDTNYAGPIDTKWHNVDEGEYMAQLKEFTQARELDGDAFNGRKVVSTKINWIIQGAEDMRERLGMDELRVQQDLLIDLTGDGRIDWGINKNMALKRLLEAFGLANAKTRNLNMFLNQVAWIVVANEPRKGGDPEQLFSNVKRVLPLEAGRAAFEAKRAAA